MSEHHDAVLYEIRQTVRETVNRSHRIAGPLNYDVATLHFGLGLIVCRGFLEKAMNKKCELPSPGKFPKRMKNISGKPFIRAIDFWQYKFDPKNAWYGWGELINFFRLVDCFTQNGGAVNGKGMSSRGSFCRTSRRCARCRRESLRRAGPRPSSTGSSSMRTCFAPSRRSETSSLLSSPRKRQTSSGGASPSRRTSCPRTSGRPLASACC